MYIGGCDCFCYCFCGDIFKYVLLVLSLMSWWIFCQGVFFIFREFRNFKVIDIYFFLDIQLLKYLNGYCEGVWYVDCWQKFFIEGWYLLNVYSVEIYKVYVLV